MINYVVRYQKATTYYTIILIINPSHFILLLVSITKNIQIHVLIYTLFYIYIQPNLGAAQHYIAQYY